MSTTPAAADVPTDPVGEITEFLRRFVAFNDPDHADVLALWVLHTWTFDTAYATPYVYVNSAEPQSGKTRVLEVCEMLARNPVKGSGITTSTLFRMIEDRSPTLFLDEADTVFSGAANEELRGCLNSGYKTGGNIWRTEGMEPRQFSTFCPKMLVGIDNAQMPDTLRDRCIPINLKRKKTDQEVERFVPRKVEPQADELRARIERWASRNTEKIMGATDPAIIDGISDRAFEIAEPLLILAAVAKRSKPARKAIHRLMAGKAPALSIGVQTLQTARSMMDDGNVDRISSSALAAHMGVNTKKLGVILSAYDITPSTLRFNTGEKLKGYNRRDFTDAWERYL